MNNPQLWGAVRGVLIALGGAVAGYGVMSVADWTVLVDRTLAVVTALAGLAAVVAPMYQGYRSRSTPNLIKATANEPTVAKVILTDTVTADSIPSTKVVGPAGF